MTVRFVLSREIKDQTRGYTLLSDIRICRIPRFCRRAAVELRMGDRPASAPILWVDGVLGLW